MPPKAAEGQGSRGAEEILPLCSSAPPLPCCGWCMALMTAGVAVHALRLPKDLARLPLTAKSELVADQAANPPWGTALGEPIERYTRYCQTSSSTGLPLRWLDTNESWQWILEC